ncbi:hypothetical protein, partial [Aerolutibacter daejeonensis]|uniref:hypothetical protein n=1 Tax=Aerolutibacter daejeonensis TaxID=346181 RepID=UPI001E506B50
MAMVLRWALALLAAFSGFAVAGIVGGLAAEFAGFWNLPGAGFSAAFAVVVLAYLAAPSHKLPAAAVALTLGAVVAWLLLEPSFYPESYGDRGAYEPTHLPVVTTYIGGLVGLLASVLIGRWAGGEFNHQVR